MRTPTLVLLIIICTFFAGCNTSRLSRIRKGMTRTDVAIELGKPAQVLRDGQSVVWVYPSSRSETCRIQFVNQKVLDEKLRCEDTERARQLASKSGKVFREMNSEQAYLGRLKRYCGIKPIPTSGCKVTDRCINGGWEEVCTGGAAEYEN